MAKNQEDILKKVNRDEQKKKHNSNIKKLSDLSLQDKDIQGYESELEEKEVKIKPHSKEKVYKKRLLLGEATFTYTEALLDKQKKHVNLGKSIVATEYRQENEVFKEYKSKETQIKNRINRLKQGETTINFGVDAQCLEERSIVLSLQETKVFSNKNNVKNAYVFFYDREKNGFSLSYIGNGSNDIVELKIDKTYSSFLEKISNKLEDSFLNAKINFRHHIDSYKSFIKKSFEDDHKDIFKKYKEKYKIPSAIFFDFNKDIKIDESSKYLYKCISVDILKIEDVLEQYKNKHVFIFDIHSKTLILYQVSKYGVPTLLEIEPTDFDIEVLQFNIQTYFDDKCTQEEIKSYILKKRDDSIASIIKENINNFWTIITSNQEHSFQPNAFSKERFPRIHFNFPYAGGEKATRDVIYNFFRSSKNTQIKDDKVLMALPQNPELILEDNKVDYKYRYGIVNSSSTAGYILEKKRNFIKNGVKRYEKYQHEATDNSRSRNPEYTVNRSREFIFSKSNLPAKKCEYESRKILSSSYVILIDKLENISALLGLEDKVDILLLPSPPKEGHELKIPESSSKHFYIFTKDKLMYMHKDIKKYENIEMHPSYLERLKEQMKIVMPEKNTRSNKELTLQEEKIKYITEMTRHSLIKYDYANFYIIDENEKIHYLYVADGKIYETQKDIDLSGELLEFFKKENVIPEKNSPKVIYKSILENIKSLTEHKPPELTDTDSSSYEEPSTNKMKK